MEHYDSVIKAREVIRKKFNELRRGESEATTALEKVFKPVTDPLNTMIQLQKGDTNSANFKSKKSIKEETPATDNGSSEDHENMKSSNSKYIGSLLESYMRNIKRKDFDLTYGLRRGNKNWLMGSEIIDFGENKIIIGDQPPINITPGLLELLFKKMPEEEGYSEEDLKTYKRMLETTNAHKQGYDEANPINRRKSNKYRLVIGKLYPEPTSPQKKKKGSGVSFVPVAAKRTYVYWDDPNELVERLSLLLASKRAGHSGHDREILSIEEELRESGFIL